MHIRTVPKYNQCYYIGMSDRPVFNLYFVTKKNIYIMLFVLSLIILLFFFQFSTLDRMFAIYK